MSPLNPQYSSPLDARIAAKLAAEKAEQTMPETSITAEIGTSGDTATVALTGDAGADIATAVELEHYDPDDASCDICRALEDGFPLWSANLLQSATEVPLLDAVIGHYCETGAITDWSALAEAERVAWLASPTWTEQAHECEACGAYTFDDDYWTAEHCGNCLAPFPALQDDELAQFVTGYIETAIWSSSIEEEFCAAWNSAHPGDDFAPDCSMLDFGLSRDDLDESAEVSIESECRDFCKANYAAICAYTERMGEWSGSDSNRGSDARYSGWEQAGGDFWLTRNGHGAGFWDRGLGELGDQLARAARVYGEAYLYVGDDESIYAT